MKALIERRPEEPFAPLAIWVPLFLNGLFILIAYAAALMTGRLGHLWLAAAWGLFVGKAIFFASDSQQCMRLVRLRVPAVHVRRWMLGLFEQTALWAGCTSLTVLWVAHWSGYTLWQASALVGLSLAGLPLYGYAWLAWKGHASPPLRGLLPLLAGVYLVMHRALWQVWTDGGQLQAMGIPLGVGLLGLLCACIGMWVLFRHMLQLGEPTPTSFMPLRSWRQVLPRLWTYWRGQGRWIGPLWFLAAAILPWSQSFFRPTMAWVDPTPDFRLFALTVLMLCLLRSDRHHWRWQLMPRLRVRQRWAYEIWGASLRFVLSLALPVCLLWCLLMLWNEGATVSALWQAHGDVWRWWAVEWMVATALAVLVRSVYWRRWQDGLWLLAIVVGFMWMLTDSAERFWLQRHVGHDGMLLLLGVAVLVKANDNLRRYGLHPWGEPTPPGRRP
jgi:hypothetical protein